MPNADNPIEKTILTSIKRPASVKAQIDESARKVGVSAHAFMVKTLSDATQRVRLREQFYQDGVDSFREVQASGLATIGPRSRSLLEPVQKTAVRSADHSGRGAARERI